MDGTILIHLPIVPPSATSQQKGAFAIPGGKGVRFFTKPKVRAAENLYASLLLAEKPDNPIEGPVAIDVLFAYPWRASEKKSVIATGRAWKTTIPDLDNASKCLLDTMTRLQFWRDDAQVCDQRFRKVWTERGGITIKISRAE